MKRKQQISHQAGVKPFSIGGTITLAGRKVQVGAGTVPFKQGVSSEELVDKLTVASKKALFPMPALTAND